MSKFFGCLPGLGQESQLTSNGLRGRKATTESFEQSIGQSIALTNRPPRPPMHQGLLCSGLLPYPLLN